MAIENLIIRTCTENDVDDIYNIQNTVIGNFKDEEKNYFFPSEREVYLNTIKNPEIEGEIYGAFIDDKMVGWICLSVAPDMMHLVEKIGNVEGLSADIDGVMVLSEYRGKGIQKSLIQHLEENAARRNIKNIVAEVTHGNVYSLRNLLDLGYEIKTWYRKNENTTRDILLKKI